MVCFEHRRPLFIAWDPVSPVHRRDWILPIGGLAFEQIEIPIPDDRQLDQLVQIATFSYELSICPPSCFDITRLARVYQEALRSHGKATARGSLRLKCLVDATRNRYRGIEAVPGFEALQSVTPDWPGLVGAVSRSCPRQSHPLKHLLIIAMLFETWQQFVDAYSTIEDAGQPDVPPAPLDDHHDEDLLRTLVVDEGYSVTAAAAKMKICTTTATQLAKRASIPFVARPKHVRGKALSRARSKLARGLPIKRVTEQVGISSISLYRLLSADSELRQSFKLSTFLTRRTKERKAFLATASDLAGKSVKLLRRVPGNGYMWLYRHDREWLRSNLPSLWQTNKTRGLRD